MPNLSLSKKPIEIKSKAQKLENKNQTITKLDQEHSLKPNEIRIKFIDKSILSYYSNIISKTGLSPIPVNNIIESRLLNSTIQRPILEKENYQQIKNYTNQDTFDCNQIKRYLDHREQNIKDNRPIQSFNQYLHDGIVGLNSNYTLTIDTVNGYPLKLDKYFFLNIELDAKSIEHINQRHCDKSNLKYNGNDQFLPGTDFDLIFNEIKENLDKAIIGNSYIKHSDKNKIYIDYSFDKVIGTSWNSRQNRNIVRIAIDESGKISTMLPVKQTKFYGKNYFVLR